MKRINLFYNVYKPYTKMTKVILGKTDYVMIKNSKKAIATFDCTCGAKNKILEGSKETVCKKCRMVYVYKIP